MRDALKFWPLIRAWLWRSPARTILAFIAVTAAFTLYGLPLTPGPSSDRKVARRGVFTGF